MAIDKSTLNKLKKFAQVFKDARDRNVNESDTVMFLIEFFKEVLMYDPLTGEISKEIAVKDRFCDFAVKLGGEVVFIVEVKSAAVKSLNAKHIEQAGNYASRLGVTWVLLTNGVEWKLYHLTFSTGIEHELVFDLNFLEAMEKENPDLAWDILSVMTKPRIKEDSLEAYYDQMKLLSPKEVVGVLLSEDVLRSVRQQLNRKSAARLDLKDVFRAVLCVISKEAIATAGDISAPAKKRKRRRRRADGQVVEEVVDATAPVEEGEEVVEMVEECPTVAPIVPPPQP